MECITKIAKFPEESGLLIKGVSKTTEKEVKEQKYGFLGIILGASLLGILLVGKAKIPGWRVIRTGEGTIRAGQYF